MAIRTPSHISFKNASPLDRVFLVSLALKGIDGLIEVIAAIVILFFSPARLHYVLDFVTHTGFAQRHELIMDLAALFSSSYTNSERYFLVVYLLIHAAVKLVSVAGLVMNKRWAYPFALITLGALTLYQIYGIFFIKPSIFMILLTIFDIFVMWLIWREYKVRILDKKRNPA